MQAIVVKLYKLYTQNMGFRLYRRALIEENKWRAARWGLDGRLDRLRQEARKCRCATSRSSCWSSSTMWWTSSAAGEHVRLRAHDPAERHERGSPARASTERPSDLKAVVAARRAADAAGGDAGLTESARRCGVERWLTVSRLGEE